MTMTMTMTYYYSIDSSSIVTSQSSLAVAVVVAVDDVRFLNAIPCTDAYAMLSITLDLLLRRCVQHCCYCCCERLLLS